uniref:Bestrophin homolog n=1 Tax=Panagrellus redivivus TaxID=6233 RepID=A0A7E4W968_PANRE
MPTIRLLWASDKEDGEGVAARASSLFGHRELEASKSSLFLHQVAAILYRFFENAYRNKIRTLFPIVFDALLFSFIAFGSSSTTVRQERDLSLINQEALTIPMQLSQDEKIAGEFCYIGHGHQHE